MKFKKAILITAISVLCVCAISVPTFAKRSSSYKASGTSVENTYTENDIVSSPNSPIDVSMINLIATPEKYDGEYVRLIGYATIGFESNVIYLHKEDHDHWLPKNGLWLDFNGEITENDAEKLSDRYVIVEGKFDSKHTGHLGMNSGAITKISRFDKWN